MLVSGNLLGMWEWVSVVVVASFVLLMFVRVKNLCEIFPSLFDRRFME